MFGTLQACGSSLHYVYMGEGGTAPSHALGASGLAGTLHKPALSEAAPAQTLQQPSAAAQGAAVPGIRSQAGIVVCQSRICLALHSAQPSA